MNTTPIDSSLDGGKNEKQQHEDIETTSSSKPKVPSKSNSPAWINFKKTECGGKAICNHCSQSISIKTNSGTTTSSMLKHMKRCKILNPELDVEIVGGKKLKQSTLFNRPNKDSNCEGVPSYLKFNQEDSRRGLLKMIIKDELPFRFVEKEGFREYMSIVQPLFVIPSRRSITRDCMSLFHEEKSKLKLFFKKHTGTVSLTTDTWTSVQNLNYMCLTAHFIDDDWNLHKKIINFCQIHSHKGEMIGKMIEKCLITWGINKVCTLTVDNASANDVAVRFLKKRLRSWGTSVLDGEFLHMRCGAHIINLVVRDGLSEMNSSVCRIRSAVRYVRSSPARLSKFKECLIHQKILTTSGLTLDVETRWNSTYLMLVSAVKLKKGFDMLELEDEKYMEELRKVGGAPTEFDWNYANLFLPILKFFYDATLKVSTTRYVTGNSYMKEIFGVGFMIRKMELSICDESLKSMATKMKIKFDKYWGENMNLMIFFVCVVDPRYKMKYVSWLIRETYDGSIAESLIEDIRRLLEKLFKVYEISTLNSSKSSNQVQEGNNSLEKVDRVMNFDLDSMMDMHEEEEVACVFKSELECYLADVCVSRSDPNFNILLWWKKSSSKYKIISLMAKDLLAIPVSTVASESAFSTSGRILDPFRSSLTPMIVEALICTQDWIRHDYPQISSEEQMEELETLEDELTTLPQGAPISLNDDWRFLLDKN